MSLADDVEAYQACLEGVRAHPDDETLREDLERARRRMEISWLEQTLGRSDQQRSHPR